MPPAARKKYHHGDLRSALIDAGVRLIAEKGVSALTLRELGATVGVSRMAAYRHFADKDDLLATISEAGFSAFADALEKARSQTRKAFPSKLTGMALAYVRFAAEHPAHFEVMFSHRTPARPSEAGDRAFGILEETIREGQAAGHIRAGDSREFAYVVWAQVHGVAMLRLAPDLSEKGAGTAFVKLCAEAIRIGLA